MANRAFCRQDEEYGLEDDETDSVFSVGYRPTIVFLLFLYLTYFYFFFCFWVIMELKRSGRTSIRKVVFQKMSPNEMLFVDERKVINLHRVTYLIYHMGFEPHVMKMINNVRPDRQTVLFFATFPKTMEALSRKVLERPAEIVSWSQCSL
ncbi:unnamed protein product [Meloidogyne enterolobii]|uniref:Uncharacterized protein n=1 Tax=Meloidogyne enterolobii TaxID=390850 RepID=A0ACB1AZR7_MELEN